MRESRSASRALSVPVLNDSRSTKSTETTANDRLLHFMAQPPKVEKHGEFGVTSQFVIEVQPSLIRNSFQTVFCLRALVSIEIPFVQTEVGPEQDSPMSSATGSFGWRWMSQTCRITDCRLKSDIEPCPKSVRMITAPGKVVGRAVAIRMQIEDLYHNTKMSRRP
jgi:hypothetical protein